LQVNYAYRMSTLQIWDVPDEVKDVLKVRAARAGQSLSEYTLAQLRHLTEQPTFEELWERIKTRGPVETTTSAADILREERDAR
jgi:antitoxin FitA